MKTQKRTGREAGATGRHDAAATADAAARGQRRRRDQEDDCGDVVAVRRHERLVRADPTANGLAVLGFLVPFAARAERALGFAGIAWAARDALAVRFSLADAFIGGTQLSVAPGTGGLPQIGRASCRERV